MTAGNRGDARAVRLNLLQNPKLVLLASGTEAFDASPTLNPPHELTIGYVAHFGISDVTSVQWAKSQRLVHQYHRPSSNWKIIALSSLLRRGVDGTSPPRPYDRTT